MFLEYIRIEDFRKIDNFEKCFDQKLTVFQSKTGEGKTTIIDGIGIGISGIFTSFTEIKIRGFNYNNDKKTIYKKQNNSNFQKNQTDIKPTITCKCRVNNDLLTWQVRNELPYEYSQRLQSSIQNFTPVNLPLVIHYGRERTWKFTKPKHLITPLEPESRTKGYENYFQPNKSQAHLLKWIYTQELRAKQENRRKNYQAFVELISQLPIGNFHYDLKTKDVIFEDDKYVKILRLAGTVERHLFGLIADIAYRMILLNPQLEDRVFEETYGIILIDDLDMDMDIESLLFLLKRLPKMFPKIQIIATIDSQRESRLGLLKEVGIKRTFLSDSFQEN